MDVSTPRRPDRCSRVDSAGVGLAVWEWGDAGDPPILFAHGGFDFAGTYDGFAPLIADAGWRVVCWDHRGHGDSDHADLYGWEADQRDAVAVMDWIGPDPIPVLGHSKGGGLLLNVADALPHRVSHLINIDGLPSRRSWPDLSERDRTSLRADAVSDWLDHRRTTAGASRKPGTIDELARRRQRMNPRLDLDWLRYLVPIGAYESEDGWRWKIDPSMRMGGVGPWQPEWSMMRLPGLGMPVLGILGLAVEVMGWGTLPEDVVPNLPERARFVPLEGVGHFVHIEQPELVAEMVLDFLP